jgi:hypothetical protein
MTRILFVGQKPQTVDFTDPSLPPGFSAEKIEAGIAVGVSKIQERGWQGDTRRIRHSVSYVSGATPATDLK